MVNSSILLERSPEPHNVNLFYKSNQARLNAYNKQRSKDLINQLKQKERINALNQQQVYNEEVANQLAELYAKFIETKSYKKSKFLPALTMEAFSQTQNETNPLLLPPSSSIPMLEEPPQSPMRIESQRTRTGSAPASLSGSPIISELKGVIDVDPQEKKKIDSLTVEQLKQKAESMGIALGTGYVKKQDLRNKIYAKLPKIKPEGSGLFARETASTRSARSFARKTRSVHRFKSQKKN